MPKNNGNDINKLENKPKNEKQVFLYKIKLFFNFLFDYIFINFIYQKKSINYFNKY